MNDHNCNKKRCLACGKKATKYGFQSNKQRWKCSFCGKVFSWKRNDVKKRNNKDLFTHWITNYQSLASVAKKKKVHRTTLTRRFENIWSEPKQKFSLGTTKTTVLILDGLYISRNCVVLVVFDSISNEPVIWGYAERENVSSWMDILSKARTANISVSGVVSDGQKGLILAVRTVFPNVPHQRCIVHIVRLSLAWLTRKPQTDAGVRLRELVVSLSHVKTKDEKLVWMDMYARWLECFEEFLKEKSINPLTGRRWYTHRKLRAVHSLIKRALPNLFVFLEDSRIPSTTNKVEGGINAPLVELLHRHRGTNIWRQQVLVSTYLSQRKKRKLPTTFAT